MGITLDSIILRSSPDWTSRSSSYWTQVQP